MYNFLEKIIEYIFIPFLVILIIVLMAIIVLAGYEFFITKEKVCKVYSEERKAHGFVMSGKAMVPTTYTTRDCLIWENYERAK